MNTTRSKLYLAALTVAFLSALTLGRVMETPPPSGEKVSARQDPKIQPPSPPPSHARSDSGLRLSPSRPSSSFDGEVPVPSPWERDNPEVFWQGVQRALATVIHERMPEARLSERDLRDLIRNIRTIRESLQGLRELGRTGENSETLKNLQAQVQWTHQIFQETLGMSVADFIERVRTEKGIDHDSPEGEEVVVEYLPDPRP